MSRKTLLLVLGIVGAILAVFGETFGLVLNAGVFMAALATITIYIFFESKADWKRMAAQAGKWKDPKFWIAIVTSVLAVINTQLGLNIPTEVVIGVLTVILGILFKVKPT